MHTVVKASYKPNYVCTSHPLSTPPFNTSAIMLSELKKQNARFHINLWAWKLWGRDTSSQS